MTTLSTQPFPQVQELRVVVTIPPLDSMTRAIALMLPHIRGLMTNTPALGLMILHKLMVEAHTMQ